MPQEFTKNILTPGPPPGVVDVAVAMILKHPPNIESISGGSAFASHEVLITKRKPNTPYEGYWEFPGGKIDPGESPDACARRECREELGIEVRVLSVLGEIIHSYSHATVRLFPCVSVVDSASSAPRALEVADFRWCGVDALPWMEFLPANVRLVTALSRYLRVAGA